jgi:hypothetical protein
MYPGAVGFLIRMRMGMVAMISSVERPKRARSGAQGDVI